MKNPPHQLRQISAPSLSLEQSNFEHDKRTVAASQPQEVAVAAKADLAVQSTAAEITGLHRVAGTLLRERVLLRRDRLRRKERNGDVGTSVINAPQFLSQPVISSLPTLASRSILN